MSRGGGRHKTRSGKRKGGHEARPQAEDSGSAGGRFASRPWAASLTHRLP
jgi:hypothetical protein